MPLQYKIPGYVGNALLLFICLVMIGQGNVAIGLLLAALAALNLFLVYKLDRFSDPEALLARELEMTKMREELLLAQRHLAALQSAASASAQGPRPNGSSPS
jgi:hypothetical protein